MGFLTRHCNLHQLPPSLHCSTAIAREGPDFALCLVTSAVRDALVCCELQAPAERAQAEQLLRVFGQSTEYITHCKASNRSPVLSVGRQQADHHQRPLLTAFMLQAILDNSQSSYAQLLASASLIKVVTEQSLR